MPELPEVETTRRGLLSAIRGKQVHQVAIRRHDLRQPVPERFAHAVAGATVLDIRRRAKYLLIDLSTGASILAHLGMSGSFTVVAAVGYHPRTHDHVLLTLDDGLLVVFNDSRRFGLLDLVPTAGAQSHILLNHLGIEPLSAEFTPDYLAERLLRRAGPIKPVLMDQKLVVGVGNIYASESLYLSGINPSIPAREAASESAAIVTAIRTTLEAAIASGGSTLRDYVGTSNEAGYFQHHFNVYDRAGESCFSCGESIRTSVQAGRATYWCACCQPLRKKRRKP